MELLNNSDNITDEVIDRACALITEEITLVLIWEEAVNIELQYLKLWLREL